MADIPGDTSTTAGITVGGSTTNSLEVLGDHDWYAISLTAGQSILINLTSPGGAVDTYVNVYDASGNTILAHDDDSPSGTDSVLGLTAPTTGTYYIDVGAWHNQTSGNYTLSVQSWTPPPVATYDQIADQLINGYWAYTGESAHHFNVSQGGTITVDIHTLTAGEQTLARAAFAEWHDIIGVNFSEVTTGAQILVTDEEDPTAGGQPSAYTEDTSSGGFTTSAHVHISASWVTQYGTTLPGGGQGLDSYAFQTYIHEIGHALGLGHSGDYNGNATFTTDASFYNDSWATSIMSYFSQTENSYFSVQGFTENYVLTPMDADIVAMQNLYGLSTTTRTGDTTYGFHSTAGEDVYNANLYPDAAYTIFDSGGTDTLDYSGFSQNELINLNPETFSNVGAGVGNVTIARGVVIENAIGGSGSDTLIGNSAANTLTGNFGNDILDGGAGNDTLNGGAGSDTATYSDATSGVTVSLASAGAQNTGGAGTDTLISIESLQGSNFDDHLTGDANANSLIGGAGNDTLDGGAGADTMAGGAGDDTYVVDNAGDVVTENAGEGTDTVNSSVTFTLGANVENLTLTGSAAIDGTGNGLDNVLHGNAAANTLDGGAGNDTLIGYDGNDTLLGGAGNDILNGVTGADQMSGGTGNDTYYVDDPGDVVTENAGEGTDTVNSSITYTLTSNVENLTLTGSAAIDGTGNSLNNLITGNSADNHLSGGSGADTIYGNAGNDTLDGGTSADHMYGGAGDDTYYVDSAGDSIGENPGAGNDTVYSSAPSYTLSANVETLILTGSSPINGTGSADDNTIIGNDADNYLTGRAGNDTLTGNGGNDHLDGQSGADTMAGGLGNDVYYVDNPGDVVIENPGEGTDTIGSFIAWTLGANVENLTLFGAASVAGLNGTGNDLDNLITGTNGDNILTGLGGNDTLYGKGGNDTLIGGDGNDRLDGGTGADAMTGGLGNDTYIVDNVGDTITENPGEGTDSVQASISYTLGANLENLTLIGSSAINGTGNSLNNLLTGNSANNILDGGAGNDRIVGGLGQDTMTGGSGNDTFAFANGDFGGATTTTADRITDFTSGQDKIDLSAVDANSLVAGDQAFTFIGTGAFSHTAGELRYEQISGNTYIEGDLNGDGIADFMIQADGLHAFVQTDFIV